MTRIWAREQPTVPLQRPRKIGKWLDSPATCLPLAMLDAGTFSLLQVGGGGDGDCDGEA